MCIGDYAPREHDLRRAIRTEISEALYLYRPVGSQSSERRIQQMDHPSTGMFPKLRSRGHLTRLSTGYSLPTKIELARIYDPT
jgi:hypothetical protein